MFNVFVAMNRLVNLYFKVTNLAVHNSVYKVYNCGLRTQLGIRLGLGLVKLDAIVVYGTNPFQYNWTI